jgi:hypothetical protein
MKMTAVVAMTAKEDCPVVVAIEMTRYRGASLASRPFPDALHSTVAVTRKRMDKPVQLRTELKYRPSYGLSRRQRPTVPQSPGRRMRSTSARKATVAIATDT